MYTEEDLSHAVDQNIFSQQAVNDFRRHISQTRNTHAVVEENFRLINGFQSASCSYRRR